MIAEKITQPIFWVLAVTALFNIMQRRHHKTCEEKRKASLYWVLLIFIFYVIDITIATKEFLPDYLLLVGFAIIVIIGIFLRKKIFPFKFKCQSCGARLSTDRILYFDSNMCEDCDPLEDDDKPDKSFLEKMLNKEKPKEEPIKEEEPLVIPETVEEVDWDSWSFTEQAVICYIKDEEKKQVLLIHKKTGLGKGKVNAPGGRIEAGEMPIEATVRECQEEVGLTPLEPKLVGELFFILRMDIHYGALFICQKNMRGL